MYNINKYILFTLPDGNLVLQNQDSIVTIKDTILKKVLLSWDQNNIRKVSIEDLQKDFGLDCTEIIEFLLGYSIINKVNPKTVLVDSISVISNHEVLKNGLFSAIKEDYRDLPVNCYGIEQFPIAKENELTIIFLSPYNKKMAKKILERQKKCDKSKVIFTYVYNSNFYIDCLYSPEWKVPCHNCHIGHIESSGLIQEEDYELTYQNMIDLLYTQDEDFLVEIPLNAVEKINILSNILNYVKKYLYLYTSTNLHEEDVTTCTMIDLNSFKKYRDTSIHWELCDCYE